MPKRKTTKLKEPIRVRTKKLSDGSESLYLDIYVNGKRSYEFLKMYLLPEINGKVKEQNRATLAAAEAIKSRRIIEITNSKGGIKRAEGWQKLLLSDWLDIYVGKKVDTGQKNAQVVRSMVNVIQPFVKKTRMGDIDKAWALRFIDWIQNTYKSHPDREKKGKPLSQGSARFYAVTLSAALNAAVRADRLGENPFMLLSADERIKKPVSQRQFLTVEEVKRLISTDCRIDIIKRAYLFSCYTSLRISDVRALKWKNVVCNEGKCLLAFVMKKTSVPNYTPLSVKAMEWMPERGESTDDDLVFKDLPSSVVIGQVLKEWSNAAQIDKHVTYHTSRHTFGTMMLTAGADLYTTSKLMGHADVRTLRFMQKLLTVRRLRLSIWWIRCLKTDRFILRDNSATIFFIIRKLPKNNHYIGYRKLWQNEHPDLSIRP